MECLRDFISVSGCSPLAAPASGLLVNDLPGVEFLNIDQIANEEQTTYLGVWNEIQNRVLRRFKTDVISVFSKKYYLKQIAQSVDIGRIIDTTATTAPTADYRGLTIELNWPTDTIVNSNLQVLFIQSIDLYLSAPANFTLYVFDLETGGTLDTFAATGLTGWNRRQINSEYSARRIFVAYDATAITSVELDITDHQLSGFYSGCDDCGYSACSDWDCGCTAIVRGATNVIADPLAPVQGSNTFGLSAVFAVQCSYQNIVCNNRMHFANALLYALGAELMTERIYSSRINRWTTVDKPKAIELRKYFEANYKGGVIDDIHYVGELTQAIEGISLNLDDCCLECNQPVMFKDSYM